MAVGVLKTHFVSIGGLLVRDAGTPNTVVYNDLLTHPLLVRTDQPDASSDAGTVCQRQFARGHFGQSGC